jgi:hypothetical protein
MTTSTASSCLCAGTPKPRASVVRRAATIATALALVALISWGETWAIEHAPTQLEPCSPATSSGWGRVLGDDCGYSAAPFAIAH